MSVLRPVFAFAASALVCGAAFCQTSTDTLILMRLDSIGNDVSTIRNYSRDSYNYLTDFYNILHGPNTYVSHDSILGRLTDSLASLERIEQYIRYTDENGYYAGIITPVLDIKNALVSDKSGVDETIGDIAFDMRDLLLTNSVFLSQISQLMLSNNAAPVAFDMTNIVALLSSQVIDNDTSWIDEIGNYEGLAWWGVGELQKWQVASSVYPNYFDWSPLTSLIDSKVNAPAYFLDFDLSDNAEALAVYATESKYLMFGTYPILTNLVSHMELTRNFEGIATNGISNINSNLATVISLLSSNTASILMDKIENGRYTYDRQSMQSIRDETSGGEFASDTGLTNRWSWSIEGLAQLPNPSIKKILDDAAVPLPEMNDAVDTVNGIQSGIRQVVDLTEFQNAPVVFENAYSSPWGSASVSIDFRLRQSALNLRDAVWRIIEVLVKLGISFHVAWLALGVVFPRLGKEVSNDVAHEKEMEDF